MAEIHDLVAPYALDALDPDEVIRFEAHLESCAACRQELTLLTESAADVASSVKEQPPPHVKDAVFSAISEEEYATVTGIDRRRATGWAVAGVAAVLALVFFGLWAMTNTRLDEANRIAAVYVAPDSQVIDIETSNGPARFVYSSSLSRGVFNGGRLADAPGSDVYQLWLIDEEGPEPAGTVPSGATDVLVEPVEPGLTLAMTVEPAPGAESPTSEPLFAEDL